MDIGTRITFLREERGLSQRALAQLLDMDPSSLSRIEGNERSLKDADLIKIAQFFNVSVDYLLCLDNVPNRQHRVYGRIPNSVKISDIFEMSYHKINAGLPIDLHGLTLVVHKLAPEEVLKIESSINEKKLVLLSIDCEPLLGESIRYYERRSDNRIIISSFNNQQPPIHYHISFKDHIHIIGEVLEIKKKFYPDGEFDFLPHPVSNSHQND